MIDFHAHLDLYPDPHAVVRECRKRSLHVLSVTTTPSAWIGTASLVGPRDRIRTALGLHPELAEQRRFELSLFDELLPRVRYVGEVGLDGCNGPRKFWQDQTAVFEHVLRSCAGIGGRILSVHSRRATSPVLDYLEDYQAAGVAILHWFSGSTRELERAIELGCWFSVGPAMTGSKKGRELAGSIPRDRILTETDAPFSARAGEPVHPWDVKKVIEDLSRSWGCSEEEVNAQIRANLQSLNASGLGPPTDRLPMEVGTG